MTVTPLSAEPPDQHETLADLRVEIDRIDAAMHAGLIARGEIIDRLIAVKARAGGGSAFRPDREASMMRHIAERHRGRLPLDTVEGIWRIIISTFTYVQAPYRVHADVAAGDAAPPVASKPPWPMKWNTLHRFTESLVYVNDFRRMWAEAPDDESQKLIKEAEKALTDAVSFHSGEYTYESIISDALEASDYAIPRPVIPSDSWHNGISEAA